MLFNGINYFNRGIVLPGPLNLNLLYGCIAIRPIIIIAIAMLIMLVFSFLYFSHNYTFYIIL